MATNPNIKPCLCCEEGQSPPSLSVARITCGWGPNEITFVNSLSTYLHSSVISQMSWKRFGNPFRADYEIDREERSVCSSGPRADECSLSFELKQTVTDFNYVLTREYRYTSEGCSPASAPCCFVYNEGGGTYVSLQRSRTCAQTDYNIIEDVTGEWQRLDGDGIAPFGRYVSGIIENEEVEDVWFLGTPGMPRSVFCSGAFPINIGGSTETAVMAPREFEIGFQETNEYGFDYVSDDEECQSHCRASQTTIRGFEDPDPYRLRFTFTPQNAAPNANHCRVIAKLYFRPYTWGTGWEDEYEFETIDFKWKPGDGQYFHEAEYPTFGVFRLGVVSVYLAGKGHPTRYNLTP